MAIPEKIISLTRDIRNKIYGRDVRESIAKGLEESGNIADNARQTSEDAVNRVNIYKAQFDQSILKGDQPAEVQALRVDPLTGETYTTAADRFEAIQRSLTRTIESIAYVPPIHQFSNIADGINAMYQALPTGAWMKIPAGEHTIDKPLILDREVNVDFSGAVLHYSGDRSQAAVQIGKESDWTRRFNIWGLIVKRDTTDKYSVEDVGIRSTNVAYANIQYSAYNFFRGLVADSGNNRGNVYTNYYPNWMYNNKESVVVTTFDATGWSNELNFHGGGYSVTSDASTENHILAKIEHNGYRNNNVRFYSPSFEDAGNKATAIDSDGASVYFFAPRFEGARVVHMRENAIDNFILRGYGSGAITRTGKASALTVISDRHYDLVTDSRGFKIRRTTASGNIFTAEYEGNVQFQVDGQGHVRSGNLSIVNEVHSRIADASVLFNTPVTSDKFKQGSLLLSKSGLQPIKTRIYGEPGSLEGVKSLQLIHSGTETNRPEPVDIGFMMFDTNIGKPIWWNGSNWIDAMGNRV